MNAGIDGARGLMGHGPDKLEVTTMARVNNRSRTMLASALVSLLGSVALNVPETLAAEADPQDSAAQTAVARGERHRHGPPSKGFFHSHPHREVTVTDRRTERPRRYGPPSKGFRTWSRPATVDRTQRLDDDSRAIRRHRRGPPGKFPWQH